ncbi:outer membrane usher protein [Klebsiella aerogenes]|uniref:outer membrane usher protein n=1 Tax=Klebsiella aerogenes TaxID=548 RepID=UPI0009BB6E6E|nr:outer membrane usher protein [Klebsiella aerogenes]
MLLSASYYCKLKTSHVFMTLALTGAAFFSCASDSVEFNTEVLDVKDRGNIDLSQFSRSGYIMPGIYSMVVRINKNELPEHQIEFYAPKDDPKGSIPCLSRTLVEKFGLKSDVMNKLSWDVERQCLLTDSIKGMEAKGDLSSSTLYLSIPQAYLEYISENWDSPALWEDGIPGVFVDYNVNVQSQREMKNSSQNYDFSGNGTVGGNIKAWRFRADWQGKLSHQNRKNRTNQREFNWSRYYMYRALPALRAKMTIGEDYLNSSIFDSFRFAGLSLNSDDNMLPPNLRGYAPEVTGVAKTNAKVTIKQQGRMLYETQVAAGPFRIQDINDAVSGELEVRVEEQDGSVQTFKINTANIPYLTRPGSIRYKLATGKPSDISHHARGPVFGSGEFSWGVSNGWSLYGGSVLSDDYKALNLGLGRDLMALGALAFDATQSQARLPKTVKATGNSYRLSYSKNFEEYGSQVTFAGYRFSQEDFMSMGEYLDALNQGGRVGNSKEMYTIRFSKQFSDLGLTAFADYNHQTYWNSPETDRYNINVASSFDIGKFKNINLSLSLQRDKHYGVNNNSFYFGLSMPWRDNSSVSYSANINNDDVTHHVSYFSRLNEHNTYNLSSGLSRNGSMASAYLTHEGSIAQVNANVSYESGQYSAMGISAQGGGTLTPKGGALHRTGIMGGTRILLDTQGVADVPVRGFGSTTNTNKFGKAVVTDISSYYRNKASIDVNSLGDNAEANNSVVQATLTEGAIGYRSFDVIAGRKAMATIRFADGSTPPFGAIVRNLSKQQTGIVNDNGSTYLTGINPGDKMKVFWEGKDQCEIQFPNSLPEDLLFNNLLLPCKRLTQQ